MVLHLVKVLAIELPTQLRQVDNLIFGILQVFTGLNALMATEICGCLKAMFRIIIVQKAYQRGRTMVIFTRRLSQRPFETNLVWGWVLTETGIRFVIFSHLRTRSLIWMSMLLVRYRSLIVPLEKSGFYFTDSRLMIGSLFNSSTVRVGIYLGRSLWLSKVTGQIVNLLGLSFDLSTGKMTLLNPTLIFQIWCQRFLFEMSFHSISLLVHPSCNIHQKNGKPSL